MKTMFNLRILCILSGEIYKSDLFRNIFSSLATIKNTNANIETKIPRENIYNFQQTKCFSFEFNVTHNAAASFHYSDINELSLVS